MAEKPIARIISQCVAMTSNFRTYFKNILNFYSSFLICRQA